MKKLSIFGNSLLMLNIAYCVFKSLMEVYEDGTYIFATEHFAPAALLTLLLLSIQKKSAIDEFNINSSKGHS